MNAFNAACLILALAFCILWLYESREGNRIIANLLEEQQFTERAKRQVIENVKHWAALARALRVDRDRLEQASCDLIHANGIMNQELREVTCELMEMKAARSKSQAALEAKIEARRAIRDDRRKRVAELVDKHKSPAFIARKLKASVPTIKQDIKAITLASKPENTSNAINALVSCAESFGVETSGDSKNVTIGALETIDVREHRTSLTAALSILMNDAEVEG